MTINFTLNKPSNIELKNFGLILGTGLVIIFGLFFPWVIGMSFPNTYPLWPWYCLLTLAPISLLAPQTLIHLYYLWMRIGIVLGWFNTRVILGIIFFLLFVPIGILMRIVKYDPMNKQFDDESLSYRKISTMPKDSNLERPF